jgi:membrane-associated phospholipid phosphatase
MKKVLFLFCIFFIQMNVFSQSRFDMNIKKEFVIGTLSLGIGLSPFFINDEPEKIYTIQNSNNINIFDRQFIFPYNKYTDIMSDYGSLALLLLPALSAAPKIKYTNTIFTYGVMYSEAVLLTFGTQGLLKEATDRYRPYMYYNGPINKKKNDYDNSFPSGATAFAFLGATFTSITFSQEYPESKLKLPIIIGSYTLATGIGTMRILAGCHFLTDVIAGAAIGSLYGWLIPWLHQKKSNEKLTITPIIDGGGGDRYVIKILKNGMLLCITRFYA